MSAENSHSSSAHIVPIAQNTRVVCKSISFGAKLRNLIHFPNIITNTSLNAEGKVSEENKKCILYIFQGCCENFIFLYTVKKYEVVNNKKYEEYVELYKNNFQSVIYLHIKKILKDYSSVNIYCV